MALVEALREGYSARVQEGPDAAGFRQMLVDWTSRGTPTTSKAGNRLAE